jgi:caffeyl-CoA reductase-Etf complex subunit CarE
MYRCRQRQILSPSRVNGQAKMGVIIDTLKCTGCGNCTFLCPVGALVIEDLKCRVGESCTSCGVCIENCSFKAIKPEVPKTVKGKKHGN